MGIGPEDRAILRLRPDFDSTTGSHGLVVETGLSGIAVRYTADGAAPTPASAEYADSIGFAGAGTIRFQAFYRGERLATAGRSPSASTLRAAGRTPSRRRPARATSAPARAR